MIKILGWGGASNKKHLFVIMGGRTSVACRRKVDTSVVYIDKVVDEAKCCFQCLRAKERIEIINNAEEREIKRCSRKQQVTV